MRFPDSRSSVFASLLPTNQELDENQIKIYFDKKIQAISSHLINIWTRLTFREQTIIIILLKKPLRRIDISNELEISPGSLSNYLTNLQNQGLILLNNNKYEISEPILKRWLENLNAQRRDSAVLIVMIRVGKRFAERKC